MRQLNLKFSFQFFTKTCFRKETDRKMLRMCNMYENCERFFYVNKLHFLEITSLEIDKVLHAFRQIYYDSDT